MNEETIDLLVIDDEPLVLEMFIDFFEEADFRVTAAANAITAFELLERQTFDAVLTDLYLEPLDGLELACFAREKHPDIVPVIVTGRPEAGDPARILGEQISFFTKPVNLFELADHIRELCEEAIQHKKKLGLLSALQLPSVSNLY